MVVVEDITQRIKFAELVLLDMRSIEAMLKTLFSNILREIELDDKFIVQEAIENKIWLEVSPTKLDVLKEIYLFNACVHIESNFKDTDIEQMLNEFSLCNKIQNNKLSKQLAMCKKNAASIIEVKLTAGLNTMHTVFRDDIIQALQSEGISVDVSSSKKHTVKMTASQTTQNTKKTKKSSR